MNDYLWSDVVQTQMCELAHLVYVKAGERGRGSFSPTSSILQKLRIGILLKANLGSHTEVPLKRERQGLDHGFYNPAFAYGNHSVGVEWV